MFEITKKFCHQIGLIAITYLVISVKLSTGFPVLDGNGDWDFNSLTHDYNKYSKNIVFSKYKINL